MGDVTVRIEDLRIGYPGQPAPAVDGMSFSIARGEVLGLLGPSGAGKTTALRAIVGLLPGWSGHIELLGRDRRAWGTEIYDRIGVAFELPVGHPRLTGREELAHFAHLHAGRCRPIDELLDSLGLADAASRPVGGFSKGMRVRLNLARALLHRPDLLFLDEPTAGLDPANAAVVRDLVSTERDRGRTILLATHDMQTAAAVCDRVAFVVDGRLAAWGSPRALRLAHGRRQLRVEHRTDEGLQTATVPLDQAPTVLAELLASGRVETVHTTEPTLEEVFTEVVGRRP